ncbi:MAG: hydrogen gas-evolving membrane-bound hydrogenase subunit E [Caldilinea sp.]|uniref:hydrogen gas-evolving membrane-bound hydrogenase subunit E n=1 Tax=Caldilinea sp. TaxID=2293560 RepID=UPI0030A7D808
MPALALSLVILFVSAPIFWLLKPHRSLWFAWLSALPPAAITVWQALQLPTVAQGNFIAERYAWAPTLGLELALRLDGLALFFGLIITGVGACIAFYTAYYFEGEPRQGFFYLVLYGFMASMLGLVWADDLLTLFIFWEGTSITSYLLIAFKSDYKGATEGARRALIVTTAGGLAMLAGMVLLGLHVGSFNISEILAAPDIAAASITPVALVLIFLGAFTKSAQFPFQFWLPGAMAAPTPASAYLHSATMVKAGVFLLARLHPAFSELPLWFWTLFLVGGFTMVLGGVSAIRYTDMKALLAYATVAVLGTLVMLLAFREKYAYEAFVVTVLAHALYKAPLFLSAGIVDHAMGTRDLRRLANLARAMPLVAATVVLAALSMSGVIPTMGFLAKELMLEQGFQRLEHGDGLVGGLMYAASVLAALFMVGAIVTLAWEAFFRRQADEHPAHLHHAPSPGFVAPALLLTLLGTVGAFFAGAYENLLFAPAIAAIAGEPTTLQLKLWHGLTPVFLTSLAAIAVGVGVFALRNRVRRAFAAAPEKFSSLAVYDATIDAIYHFAYRLTTVIQGSPMAPQVSVTLLAGVAVVVYALFFPTARTSVLLDSLEIPSIAEWLIFALAILGALATVRARSRLSAIISLGVVGITVTIFFIVFGAPDLALTQLLIEVLTVILLVLVFFRVRPDPFVEDDRRRAFRLFVAIAMGFFGFTVVMVNHVTQIGESISPYFLEKSYSLGKGTNVVNVILVDFRGYDTLGEITVLGLAALGGYALLRSPQIHKLRRRIVAARSAGEDGAQPVSPMKHEATEVGHD